MPLTVNMPQLGESVTEGTIARWLKHPGDPIAKYESIAEVVTDKVNAEIPAPADGTMAELIAPEGAVVAVGEPICSIETGASAPAAAQPAPAADAQPAPAADAQSAPAADAQPAPAPAAQPAPPEPEPAATPIPAAAVAGQPAPAQPAVPETGNGAGDYHLTPAVRMLVREHGVRLSEVTGSGIGGRMTKKDVLEYVQRRDAGEIAARAATTAAPAAQPEAPAPAATAQAAPPAPAQPAPSRGEGDTVVPLTPARRSIAEHMVRSRQTSPHAYLMVEVDMSAVSALRERERAEFERRNGVKLTFLPFVARVVCEALRRHPTLNASWSAEGIVLKHDINLGIAVALQESLVVPVVRHADRLSIAGLATTMADLGERARSNHLKLDEIQGGTFTLNNTGALGAVMTQAIINQPQAGIMTMDLVVKRPVVVDGDKIAIRPVMNLGLSFDHRINDGLPATAFVRTVKQLLESFDENAALL